MSPHPGNNPSPLDELHELSTRIRKLLAASNVNCYQIGKHYNHAVDNRLAEKAGFKNAPEFFTQQIKDLSRTTLVTYGAVVRVFNEEICGLYGMTTLSLVLVYAEAAGSELDTNDPGTMLIQVPNSEGVAEEKFFGECTVADMRKAIQRLRRPTSSKPLPADIQGRVEQCRTVFTGYFPEKAGVRVEVRNQKGKAVVSLKNIPLEQVEQLAALLSTGARSARAA
jgi:hypothetical protein